MHRLGDVVSLLVGVALLGAALTARSFHKKALGRNKLGPAIPTSRGRIFASVVALGFLLSGLWDLVFGR